ncbi:MAG: glycosyltransferase, partial [Limnobacter sp.]|nr:glycosyltransferase [Limnobacter sp.]
MNWFERLENLLDLRHMPYAPTGLRVRRIVRAIWFRPNSLASQTQKSDHWILQFFWTLIRLVFLAVKDVLRPFWLLIVYAFKPVVWLNRRIDDGLDCLTQKTNPGKPMEATSRFFQKNKILMGVTLIAAVTLFLFVAQASLPLIGQWIFVLICYFAARIFRRLPPRMGHLCLMVLTLLLLGRYVFWRFTSSLDLVDGMESFLGYTLIIAEAYTWSILLLGFIQTAWPLGRKPVQLSVAPDQWPNVDVFIPTYNEPLSVVKPTIFAAKGMDWPAGKLTVYLLDDGHRPDFEAFAAQAGVEYISRPDNSHAKAGNINYALKQTNGEFIAIFDCDHIPCRSFLQTTMGWMLANDRNALVQTPHHFFSADPFERNYDMFREVPNEGELFYGLLQDSNDYWNATFFCGSCAVIRRKPLEEVGGDRRLAQGPLETTGGAPLEA